MEEPVNKGGRPTTYTDELGEMAEEYLLSYKELGDVIPSIAGMALKLNASKSTLYEWASSERGNVSDTLDRCNQLQESVLINKGLDGTHNPTITKLMMSNHGYREKTEIASTMGLYETALIEAEESE